MALLPAEVRDAGELPELSHRSTAEETRRRVARFEAPGGDGLRAHARPLRPHAPANGRTADSSRLRGRATAGTLLGQRLAGRCGAAAGVAYEKRSNMNKRFYLITRDLHLYFGL